MERALVEHRPWAIVNFAAQPMWTGSIHYPEDFIETNIVGTAKFLACVLSYWNKVRPKIFAFSICQRDRSSTDPWPDGAAFTNRTLQAHSPYSASKAASDHLVRGLCSTPTAFRPSRSIAPIIRASPTPGKTHPPHHPSGPLGKAHPPLRRRPTGFVTGSLWPTTAMPSNGS